MRCAPRRSWSIALTATAAAQGCAPSASSDAVADATAPDARPAKDAGQPPYDAAPPPRADGGVVCPNATLLLACDELKSGSPWPCQADTGDAVDAGDGGVAVNAPSPHAAYCGVDRSDDVAYVHYEVEVRIDEMDLTTPGAFAHVIGLDLGTPAAPYYVGLEIASPSPADGTAAWELWSGTSADGGAADGRKLNVPAKVGEWATVFTDLDVAQSTYHVTVNGIHGAYPLTSPPPGHLQRAAFGVTWRGDTGTGYRLTYRNLVVAAF